MRLEHSQGAIQSQERTRSKDGNPPRGDAQIQDDARQTLASDVEIADTFFSRARGLMFRRSIPDDYAMVFRFDEPATRMLHMVFVPVDLDALWLVDTEVVATKRLHAWRGFGSGVADTVVELPAGAAADVEVGDTVRIVE